MVVMCPVLIRVLIDQSVETELAILKSADWRSFFFPRLPLIKTMVVSFLFLFFLRSHLRLSSSASNIKPEDLSPEPPREPRRRGRATDWRTIKEREAKAVACDVKRRPQTCKMNLVYIRQERERERGGMAVWSVYGSRENKTAAETKKLLIFHVVLVRWRLLQMTTEEEEDKHTSCDSQRTRSEWERKLSSLAASDCPRRPLNSLSFKNRRRHFWRLRASVSCSTYFYFLGGVNYPFKTSEQRQLMRARASWGKHYF